MIKFDISEEIIFSIKTGNYKKNLIKNRDLLCSFLDKISERNILIFHGLNGRVREILCFEIVKEFLDNRYKHIENLSVFKINYVNEIDEIYLEDRFQIFYLNDFFGRIKFDLLKFENYIERIRNSKNKILIVSLRDFSIPKNYFLKFEKFCEDLKNFENEFLKIEIEDFISEDLENIYSKLFYIDKFVLFSVFMDSFEELDVWIKIIKSYFLGKRILREGNDFDDLIIDSFKKLEGKFIYIKEDGKFYVKDIAVHEFLISKIKIEADIVKDLIFNVHSFEILKRFIYVLKDLRIKINYNYSEYEGGLKSRLFELICLNSSREIINNLKFSLDLFEILGIVDFDIVEDLNNRIVYLNLDIDKVLEYICAVRNFNEVLIRDTIFENKIRNLIYEYSPLRDAEFYSHSFKYFFLVSEFHNLYSGINMEDILDIKNHFYRLTDVILNSINSYFTLEYFSLSKDIKCALVDLKTLIDDFYVKFIFKKDVEKIFSNITYRFSDLINNAMDFEVLNKKHYYMLKYFENEIERNRDFLEFVFDDINFDFVVGEIREKIHKFSS